MLITKQYKLDRKIDRESPIFESKNNLPELIMKKKASPSIMLGWSFLMMLLLRKRAEKVKIVLSLEILENQTIVWSLRNSWPKSL